MCRLLRMYLNDLKIGRFENLTVKPNLKIIYFQIISS